MEAWEKVKWIEVFLWLGLYQCLIMMPVILLKKGANRLSNFILAGFLLLMTCRLCFSLMTHGSLPMLWSSSPKFGFAFLFLYGPIYYFYLKSYIEVDFKFRPKHLWHLLPCLLICILSIVDYYINGAEDVYIMVERLRHEPPPLPFRIVAFLFIGQLLVYIFLGVRRVMFFGRYIRNSADDEEQGKVGWLAFFAWVLLIPVFSVFMLRTLSWCVLFFFFNDTATTEIYTLSLHDALPIYKGYKWGIFPKILRLSPKNIHKQLGNFLVLREKMLIDYQEQLKNLSLPNKEQVLDRKSTRLNSSHLVISYAVFCLKKKNKKKNKIKK